MNDIQCKGCGESPGPKGHISHQIWCPVLAFGRVALLPAGNRRASTSSCHFAAAISALRDDVAVALTDLKEEFAVALSDLKQEQNRTLDALLGVLKHLST